MLSIIIPTKQRENIFYETVIALDQALQFFNYDYEVIIVNNDDKSLSIALPNDFKLINCNTGGVAAARNMGAKYANGDILIFLDNDILISSESLKKSYEYFINLSNLNDKMVLNFNWVYPQNIYDKLTQKPFGRYILYYGFDKYEGKAWTNITFDKNNEYIKTNMFTSCAFFIKKSIFSQIGGYNDNFKFAGYEDNDFKEKLIKNNIDIYLLPNIYVYHNEKDFLDLKKFLERKYRSAYTRKQAVDLGDSDLLLQHSYLKKFILNIIWFFRNFFISFVNNFFKTKKFDFITFKIIDALLAAYIYKGYNSK
jgi:GT2 family glycosyltransferase